MNKILIWSALTLGLASCNGGGTTDGYLPPSPVVARVEIDQPSLLLTGTGKSVPITASAYDASGKKLSTPVQFESSRPEVAAVGADQVQALTVGSTQITAVAGSVRSRPVIAAVATLNSDVTEVAAANVLAGPNFVGLAPDQAPTVGSQYTVVVQNLTPTLGKKWFSQGRSSNDQGGQRLQGKIVNVQDYPGGGKLVTLEVTPYEEIFSKLLIDEEINFSGAPDTVPPGFAPQAFVGNGAVECELSDVGTTPPITLAVPTMNIGFNTDESRTGIRVNVGFGSENVVKVRFRGTLDASLALSGRITRNFSGSVDCRTRIPITRNIAGIPLPLFTSLTSERGLGVKFSGDFSGPDTTFEAQGGLRVALDLGASLNLSSGQITRFNTVTPTPSGVLQMSSGDEVTRFDASAEAYVFDNWILRAGPAAFDLWVDKNGIRQVAALVSVPQQITSGTRNTLKLEGFGRNGPGREFDNFLRFFNARELAPATETYTDMIRAAPFTLDIFNCNAMSTAPTRALCVTRFTERSYPVLGDNILKLEVWVRRGTAVPFLLTQDTSVSASTITTFTPAATALQTGDTCFLAVYTKAMPIVGMVTGNGTSCL
ncbi:hypothetical protein LAJ19_20995 (plasmid) [Deinococcus taeanensis]|uniref:hypothetical protein n=1 Tax=Deinococcus taeanensis TaxID=2737050 RepID=UPI001CDBC3AF|nr:hypothetical protein [Deinococcus taeanensis]UBV45275.1 hypothetical protein LAJ19_20995 [Deinococcus taeanensis]